MLYAAKLSAASVLLFLLSLQRHLQLCVTNFLSVILLHERLHIFYLFFFFASTQEYRCFNYAFNFYAAFVSDMFLIIYFIFIWLLHVFACSIFYCAWNCSLAGFLLAAILFSSICFVSTIFSCFCYFFCILCFASIVLIYTWTHFRFKISSNFYLRQLVGDCSPFVYLFLTLL